ncbi:hypothetical protein BHE74_00042594 [Ensete ventricosum]|nr:hypothetical protein GW17_00046825 [Ensete ventricosum]RWW51100.1 hypothetical protein BHE74_00042594 [Ensete ventricosum]RZS17466.1 hypothetical protein BHM03_00049603 [Ensete ventricosum]
MEMMAADLNPGINVQPAVSISRVRGAVGPPLSVPGNDDVTRDTPPLIASRNIRIVIALNERRESTYVCGEERRHEKPVTCSAGHVSWHAVSGCRRVFSPRSRGPLRVGLAAKVKRPSLL